ncbi:MAG: HD domain-containing protein [Chloroflexi bacterium]|nr:HD domain-containing protein [Chloroflexota bacterium]
MDYATLIPQVREFCAARGVPGYLVGGCVRDGLLGRPRADLDLAVEGDALALARALADTLGGAYVPLHEVHRIARVVLPGAANRRALVLDVVEAAQGILADLRRRDFTVNALAVPLDALPEDGDWQAAPVLDVTGGRSDLVARVLRAVSAQVFQDDPLRLLRAVRLAAELGFTIAAETRSLIARDAALLSHVAGERVHEELCRIFAAHGTAHAIRLMDGLGLLEALLPEVCAGKGVAQPKEHHWDVFNHNVETVAYLEAILDRDGERTGLPDDPLDLVPWVPEVGAYFQQEIGGQRRATLLKLAGLLHDVAKPQTKGPDATGRIRFLGHADLGAQLCAGILTRLRFGSKEIQAVCTMVQYHLRPGQISSDRQIPTDRAVYRYFRDVGDVALDTIYLNLADHLAARGPGLFWEEWQAHTAVVAHVLDRSLSEQRVVAPPKLVTGHEIMTRFGIGPGPRVGRMLEAVREAQAVGDVTTQEQALIYLERWLQVDHTQAPS